MRGARRSAAVREVPASFASDDSGATAVEFGVVALPFLMMVFFIINIGFYYFTINSLDKGVSDATRQVLTGTAQSNNMTVGQFKSLICSQANIGGGTIDCTKLTILITSSTTGWADLIAKAGAQSCTSNGTLNASTGQASDLLAAYTNGTSAYVMVTACYSWNGSKLLPYFNFSRLSDGTTLMQSAIAFETEPYS